MKTLIKNVIVNIELDNLIGIELVSILNGIVCCENEHQLRCSMPNYFEKSIHFDGGFGGHHMWVKQRINGVLRQQVIFVEFD